MPEEPPSGNFSEAPTVETLEILIFVSEFEGVVTEKMYEVLEMRWGVKGLSALEQAQRLAETEGATHDHVLVNIGVG